jgi:putative transposase
VREVSLLRDTVRKVRMRYPFHMDAWVVLPDHLHAVLTLPPGDADFGLRWRLIKTARGGLKYEVQHLPGCGLVW